ncbi:MAG: glycerol-3-phosphate acyltransferase [Acidimicrobiales bacterium]
MPVVAWAACVVAYLVGSIPSAVVVARRHGVDIRAVGDRNPGWWNTQATLGKRSAVPVFVVDAAKGLVAGGLGHLVAGGRWWVPYVVVGAAMVGHAWPVFASFRGGRCVLTLVGGFVAIAPIAALVTLLVCVALWGVTRRFEWFARSGVFGFPVVQAVFDPLVHVAATGALMSFVGFRFAQAALSERRGAGHAGLHHEKPS